MVFDKVEGGVMRLLEIFIKTNSGRLVGKPQLYDPPTFFDSGQVQPDLGWCILYIVRNFLVFVSSFASSYNV